MRRKAISNIISSVLLIAVSVSIATVYAQWAPEFSKNATNKVSGQTNTDIKCRNAGIAIRSPIYDKSSETFSFDLANTGTIRLTKGVNIILLNNSQVINRTTASSLEIEEERHISMEVTKIPDRAITSSIECPPTETEVGKELIRVRG